MKAFEDTKKLFQEFTHYTRPLSYEEWLASPQDDKAALLYVQFYNEITLAWYKTKSFFVLEEDGVSTMIQYLMKNVPVIESNPKRFKPGYIYRVAYNCLYCISHDIKRDIERFECETSNIISDASGEEFDLFDITITDTDDADEILTKKKFWSIIDSMGLETEKVINYLLNSQSLDKAKFKMSDPSIRASWSKKTEKEKSTESFSYQCAKNNYELDPLKDLSVSADRCQEIIEELKEKLEAFKSVYYV